MDFIFDDDVDEVGSEIEAYCPKCKADTAHVVMSKYEDEIRRVQCNPCGDVHAFRKPRGDADDDSPEPPASKKRAAKAKPTWEQVTAKAKKEPKLYRVDDRYVDNDLVSHPKFGIGFVSEVIDLGKIELTFQNERRVLVHNRKGMSLPPAAYAHAVDAALPATGRSRKKSAVEKAAVAPVERAAAPSGKKAAPTKVVPIAKAVPGKPAKAAAPPAKTVVAKVSPAKAQAAKAPAAKAKDSKAVKAPAAKAKKGAAAPSRDRNRKVAEKRPAKPVKAAARKPVKPAAARIAKPKPKARPATPIRSKTAARPAAKSRASAGHKSKAVKKR